MEVLKELQKVQEKSEKDFAPHLIGDVQKLLEYDSQIDRKILKDMGLDSKIQHAETLKGKQITLEDFRNKFKGQIFHIDTIKKLAMDYRLRLLKTCNYRGGVDIQVPAMIKEFQKEAGLELNSALLSERFFILAPPKAFNLKNIEIPKKPSALKRFFDTMKDPILFYQIDEQHYRLVHKWGNDFSIFRALQGFRWKSEANFALFGFLLALVASTAATSLVFPSSFIGTGWFYVFTGALTVITGFIHYFSNVKNSEFIEKNLTPQNWMTAEKYK